MNSKLDSANKQPAKLEPLFRRAAADLLVARALSHPMRLAVVLCLMHNEGEPVDEAKLAESLGLSPLAMRYHLIVLRDADLITCVESGGTERYVVATTAA